MKRELVQKTKANLKNHFVDSTAMLAATSPLFAGLETMVLGMSDEVSINARLLAAGLTYGGLGFFVSKGRDLYRKLANVDDNTKERVQKLHDSVYMGLFQFMMAPPFYYAAGSRNMDEIIGGMATATAFGLVSGGFVGYAIDAYRDLTGIKQTHRIPDLIKNMGPKMKLGLVMAITAASIALNAVVYELTNNKKQENPKINNTEKIAVYNSLTR